MRQATFTEVRNHAKTYFDIVESGESVRVLRNGKAHCGHRACRRRSSLVEAAQGPTSSAGWCVGQSHDARRA